MNLIEVRLAKTPYVNEEHLAIFVDAKRLDILISELLNDELCIGLIPTWLGWLVNENEQKYVWSHTELDGKPNVVPILICPDDLDFSCTTVVVEVYCTDKTVIWNRFGFDMTGASSYIGENIEWIDHSPSYEFTNSDYIECIDTFKKANSYF